MTPILRKHYYYYYPRRSPEIWMRGKFHENLCIVAITCTHARERIALKRCFNCQREAGFPCMRMSQVVCKHMPCVYMYVCTCVCMYVRNLQSLEILLVVPWKMYDALLLKASKRKFQCLDISPCSALRIHPRPSSFRNTVTFSKPHPTRKVGINVNRMSVRSSRKAALRWRIKGTLLFALVYMQSSLSKNSLS